MRFDDVGLFWQDMPTERVRGKAVQLPMPEIPETGWRAPKEFPNLSGARRIALDVETYDPELEDHGPGWGRGVGHLVGVSLAVDGGSWYFPMRHETCPEQNMDPEQVLRYLRDVLSNPAQPKLGANITYDIGWLRQEGVHVKGQLIDVQYAEALIETNARVALDLLATKYTDEVKETDLLYKWLGDWYPAIKGGHLRKFIYKAPPSLVGKYAESDAYLPLVIASEQFKVLQSEGMLDLFKMECDLINLLIDMRFQGVKVDLDKAERTREMLIKQEDEAQARLNKLAGLEVGITLKDTLVAAFDKQGLPYPRTKKGAPSFTKAFLSGLDHPLGKAINEVRAINKLRTTFIDGHILGSHTNGKIHCQFHPLKGESGGTGYGRFSSSDPNLQQIPSRNKQWAKIIRGIFVPDDGYIAWRKYDYSQIEYRFLAHFAYGPHAALIQQAYINNPRTDFHKQTGDRIEATTGRKLEHRSLIKNINFGMAYGMGVAKLMEGLGLAKDVAKSFIDSYNEANPFVKDTFNHCAEEASDYGFITTVLGRKARFDNWGPKGYKNRFDPITGLPKPTFKNYHQALKEYGSVELAFTHKALNNRLQGSSADQIKKAMVDCYQAGIFDATGVPVLQVHDELDFQDPGTKEADEAFVEMAHIMETCLPNLKVPIIVDCEIGPDWGNVTDAVAPFSSITSR